MTVCAATHWPVPFAAVALQQTTLLYTCPMGVFSTREWCDDAWQLARRPSPKQEKQGQKE